MIEGDDSHYEQWLPRVAPDEELPLDELYDQSLGFREQFGLSTDPALISSTLLDTAYEASRRLYGVALTPAEMASMSRRHGMVSGASDARSVRTATDGTLMARNAERLGGPSTIDDVAPPDPVERYATADAPETYAGQYVEGDNLVVAYTEGAESHLATLQELVGADVRVVDATYSKRQLDATTAAVAEDDAALVGLGIDVSEVYPDYQANSVVVAVEGFTDAQAATLRSRYGPSIVLEDDAIEPTSRRTYHNPVFGGLAIEHPYSLRYETNCTLGFGFAALGFYEELR